MAEIRPRRALFVDDEPLVLSALRRLLFSVERWDCVFVDCGEAALQQLEAEPFDVLVTDMRMPGMDGLTLLRLVHERFPGIVRIAISGYLDEELALRALAISHQFIAKPCARDVLVQALDRAWRVQQVVSDQKLRDVVGSIVDLPSRPTIYSQLTRALGDEQVSIEDVAAIIEQDIALSAKVLHIVNSAFLAPLQRITSVHPAVARIGLSRIKFLVLAAEVFSQLRGPTPAGWSLDAMFERSLLVAQLAMEVADHDRTTAEGAFLAGMLHDIGQLVLLSRLPSYFQQVVREARQSSRPLDEVERELRGTTHAEVGAYLLGLWGLPYPIMEAVANHHAPERAGRGLDTANAVLIAGQLADEALQARQRLAIPGAPPLDADLLQRLGVEPASFDLVAWRSRAAQLVAQAGPGSRSQP